MSYSSDDIDDTAGGLHIEPDTPPMLRHRHQPRSFDSLDRRGVENLSQFDSPARSNQVEEDDKYMSDEYDDQLMRHNELENIASKEYLHGADHDIDMLSGGEYDEDNMNENEPFLGHGARSGDDVDDLEKDGKKKPIQFRYKIALRSLYFLAFIMYADLSIILPTALRYFQSMLDSCHTNQIQNPGEVDDTNLLPEKCNKQANLYLALALATYSTCQFVFAPLAGIIARRIKKMKILFLIMIVCCGLGNLVYSTAGQYGSGADPIIAEIGRALAGFGAASIGTSFAYIALVTEPESRTEHIATFRVYGNIGLLVSPGLAFVLTFLNFDIGALHFDGLNLAGWVMALFCVIEFFLLFFFMEDPPAEAISGEDQKGDGANHSTYWSLGVIVNLFFAFFLGFESITFEFMLAPLTAAKFHWSPTVLSFYMFIAGLSVLPGIMTVKYGKKLAIVQRIGERFFIICSWLFTLVGLIFMWLPFTELFEVNIIFGQISFCVGGIVVFFFFCWGSATQPALVSLIIPPASRIIMMPWVAAMTSFGRIVGPLWSQWAISVASGGDFLFMFLFCLCGWCLYLTILLWPRFKAGYFKIEHPELADEEDTGEVVFAGGH